MKITEVKISRPPNTDAALKGYASVLFDNELAVHDIKILEGRKGFYIAFPSRKTRQDTYVDVVHPINTAFRNMVQDAILAKFQDE